MTDELENAKAPDTELIDLGLEFEAITSQLDHAIMQKREIADFLLKRLSEVETAILAASAKSTQGLCVKARAACWARLGDLDPSSESSTDKRMALSIVRDLIRLYDPGLESEDALKNLAAHT